MKCFLILFVLASSFGLPWLLTLAGAFVTDLFNLNAVDVWAESWEDGGEYQCSGRP